MSTQKLDAIVDIIQGHQITEEEVYNSFGSTPIYTGNDVRIGYVDTQLVSLKQLPVITYPTKGQVGNFYIKNEIFEANNTGVLVVKDEWRDKINLVWLVSQLRAKVRVASNSKFGVGYIGKEIMERITIDIPSPQRQQEIAKQYKSVEVAIKSVDLKINDLQNLIRNTKFRSLKIVSQVKIDDVFNFLGGNSGLTEEFIYHNLATNGDDMIRVVTGATGDGNRSFVSSKSKINGSNIKVFTGPAIVVVRKGLAGKMQIIDDANFAINDDAYVMELKDEYKNAINIRWFQYQCQEMFYNLVSSRSDNATFNKGYAQKQKIELPSKADQDRAGSLIGEIETTISTLMTKRNQLEDLLNVKPI